MSKPVTPETAKKRLEYLRGEIRAERISYGEIAELQALAQHIEPEDVELLQWADAPEGKEAHTPVPWKITKCIDDARGSFYIRGTDETGADMPLCVTRHGPEEANARLIVTAVNSYEELLEACKLQRDAIDILFARLIEKDPKFFPSTSGKPWEALLAGRTAIARAEGKEGV